MKKQAPGLDVLLTAILYNRPPDALYFCIGMEAKKDYEAINRPRNGRLAVLLSENRHPSSYNLPVKGLDCMILWSLGPNKAYIKQLVNELLGRGALRVTVIPVFENFENHSHDLVDGKWVQVREKIQTFTNNNDDDNIPEQ